MSTAGWPRPEDTERRAQAKHDLVATKPDPDAPLFTLPEEMGEHKKQRQGNFIAWLIVAIAAGSVAGVLGGLWVINNLFM